jgi:predicted ribosomally synthesized peptide with SipW-like signal peptide
MTRRLASLVLVAASLSFLVGATLATFTDSQTAQGEVNAGFWAVPEGCSHGFWKTHPEAWVGFTTGQTVEDVFDVPDEYGLDADSLLDALGYGGGPGAAGGAKILLQQAVAAVLNAEHPGVNYPRSTPDVIAAVNSALASGDRGAMIALADLLNLDNNLGCPLGLPE